VYGGDFLANQPPAKAMCEMAPAIIYLFDRMGVPFFANAGRPAGFSALRRPPSIIALLLPELPPANNCCTRWMSKCGVMKLRAR